ncbi:hypothetical protein [Gymnodinialimonas ceratoperidinii]|uniref:Cytochrome C oxidase assembly protein n=1 Tax=Gymnodinialimonas ceratoperidinii TaxID=2856823 RepID=A0A8F6TZC4_9RHOB|nr:hypothetical protein [Gymnodinialimonas ceratoperidinii]QXT40939.1 hypothetical protein KYE46_06865 [Gymnodinialimonas ceratoperidinii]
MAEGKGLTETHEIHKRRLGRNVGTALCLLGFCAIVFGLTVAKVREGGLLEANDHVPRASVLPITEDTQ